MHVIDRDRYVVAHGLGAIEKAIGARTWLLEGRGPYEWDDDRYRDEFGAAIEEIRNATEPLRLVAWDKSDCTRIEERVNAARIAARDLLTKLNGTREMIEADIFPDLRDTEIKRLTARVSALEEENGRLVEALEQIDAPWYDTDGAIDEIRSIALAARALSDGER